MARGRKGGGTIGSTRHAIPTERAFGTPEEIAGRDSAFPQESATTFVQIGPSDGGTSLANADQACTDRSGAFKFSSGV